MRRPCRTCSKDWPLGAGSCTEPSFSFKSTFSFSSSTSSTFEAEPEPKTEAGEGRVDDPPPRASARERRDSGDGSTSVDGAELEFVGDVVELLFVGGSEFVVRANSVRKGCVGVEKIEDGDGDGDGGGEERDEEREGRYHRPCMYLGESLPPPPTWASSLSTHRRPRVRLSARRTAPA